MFDLNQIQQAAEILQHGGVVAFPTETVYGLGARVSDEAAIRRVFTIKGRPADNPVIVHVASLEQAERLVTNLPDHARSLMATFWPGPLTIVLPRSPHIPSVVTAGLTTVAIRMPEHRVASTLIRMTGEPIAAPSANRSGRPSPTHVEHVRREIGGDVDMILDGDTCRIGLESTVIDLSEEGPCILRSGAITGDMIQTAIGRMALNEPSHETASPKSPGTRHRHYAPSCKIIPVLPDTWAQVLNEWRNTNKRIGGVSRKPAVKDESLEFYRHVPGPVEEYGKELFAAFFDAEAANIDVLLVETVEEEGIGSAIMDRIRRTGETKE